ncbi:MAG: hypothetical protein OHK0036_11760 [Bacteroidia bacterium]
MKIINKILITYIMCTFLSCHVYYVDKNDLIFRLQNNRFKFWYEPVQYINLNNSSEKLNGEALIVVLISEIFLNTMIDKTHKPYFFYNTLDTFKIYSTHQNNFNYKYINLNQYPLADLMKVKTPYKTYKISPFHLFIHNDTLWRIVSPSKDFTIRKDKKFYIPVKDIISVKITLSKKIKN